MRYIVANWKQNKTIQQALAWLMAYNDAVREIPSDVEVVVAAPFTLLSQMKKYISEEDINLSLAAQNISAHESGAFTGEVGYEQLADLVDHVIIGHSERRMYFGDTNEIVSEKVALANKAGLGAFVCIADQVTESGNVPETKIETSDEDFERQITSVFSKTDDPKKVVLVYEPISAISTFGGKPLTTDEAVEALKHVSNISQADVPVMYGGSVNAKNINEYWPSPSVAGVMPGGASLDIRSFLDILEQVRQN